MEKESPALLDPNTAPERPLNAIIIFDKGSTENTYTGAMALRYHLQDALRQKVAPILVTGSILHSFHTRRTKATQKLKNDPSFIEKIQNIVTEQKKVEQTVDDINHSITDLQTKITNILKDAAQNPHYQTQLAQLYTEKINLEAKKIALNKQLSLEGTHTDKTIDLINLYCAQVVPFNFNEWYVYKHVKSDIYLLIPQLYKQYLKNNWQAIQKNNQKDITKITQKNGITEQELMLGFMVDHTNILIPIKNIEELDKQLNNTWGTLKRKLLMPSIVSDFMNLDTIHTIDPLLSFFVTSHKYNPLYGLWNIYLIGHGLTSLLRFEWTINNLRAQSYGAYIAGFTVPEFNKFIKFLHNNIHTSFFYWMTCYGGGYNLKLVTDMLQHLENAQKLEVEQVPSLKTNTHNFIAASGALTDAPTEPADIVVLLKSCLNDQNVIDFKTFFDTLAVLTHDIAQSKQTLARMQQVDPTRREQLIKTLLLPDMVKALKAVTPTQLETKNWIYSTPSVYIPGHKQFKVPGFDYNIAIFDKKYLSLYKPYPLWLFNKSAVLLYEPTVANVITITADQEIPLLISMIPGNAIHNLNTLVFRRSDGTLYYLQYILFHSFFKPEVVYDKIFKINKIQNIIFDDQKSNRVYEVENVVIHRSGTISGYTGTIIFTTKNANNDHNTFFKGTWTNKGTIDFEEINANQYAKEKSKMLKQFEK